MEFLASIDQLHKILTWIKEELKEMHFEKGKLSQVELASEEALVNIITHAYQGRTEKVEIQVKCFVKSHAEITFIDNGPPFNPLKAKELDPNLPLEKRAVGGMGIHFMRKCVDEIRYLRVKDKNVLVFVIRIGSFSQKR